jgi:hypothetical protein
MTPYIDYKKVGFCGSLWLFSSGLYLTKLAPLSPIHVAFCILCLIVYFKFASKNSYVIGTVSFVPLLANIYFLLLFITSPASAVLNIIVTFTSPLLVYVFFYGKRISNSKMNNFLLFYALLFLFDGIWRLLNPAELELEKLAKLNELAIGFQIYKLNTFMYMDSNFVGLQACSVFSFMCWLSYSGIKQSKLIFLTLSIAILLTFSRSAIIVCIFSVFMMLLFQSKIPKIILNFFFIIFSSSVVVLVFIIFSNDVSFMSKFHIFSVTQEYLIRENWLNLFLGVGIGNAKEYLGIGAHNLLVTFLVETGIIGLIVFLAINLYWYSILKKGWLVVVFPFLLASMSLGTTAIPYLFTLVTMAILIKRNKLIVENSNRSYE